MHDAMRPHQLKRGEHLDREPADQGGRKSGKRVGLDELVEVDTEQLGDDAKVTSEVEVIRHSDHEMVILGILHLSAFTLPVDIIVILTDPFAELLKDLDLDKSLSVEPFLVSDDLDGDRLTRLVIPSLHDLPERPFTKNRPHLVPVAHVIAFHDQVVATLIIEAVVVSRAVGANRSDDLTSRGEEDVFVVEYLLAFVV